MAFGDSWLISVMMRFSGNGSQYMSELSRAMEAANRSVLTTTGNVDRATLAMRNFRNSVVVAGTQIAGTFATIGAVVGAFSVDQAANLERQMKLFQMATGYTPKQMQAVQSQVYRTGAATAQSVGTVGSEFVAITQMGLSPGLMTPSFLDKMTKFGDVINLQSQNQIAAADAIKIAISSAHQLGIYSTGGIESLATALMKTSFILPHGIQRFATQSKYFAPWLRTFGDSPDSINQLMSLSWLLDVSGLSTGRGGTSIAAMMRNMNAALQVTKYNQSGRRSLLESMGLLKPDGTPVAVTTDSAGRPYLSADIFTSHLYDYVQSHTKGLHGEALIRARSSIANNLQGVFGTQGGLFASILSNSGMQQLKMFHDRFAKTPRGIDQAQTEVLDTFWGSLQKATTSVQNFSAAMGSPGLKNFEHTLETIAGAFNNATGWANRHPRMTSLFAGTGYVLTGLASLTWIGGKVYGIGRNVVGFGKSIAELETPIFNATRFLGGLGGAIGRIAGILTKFSGGPWSWILASLDNAKASGPVGISWTAAMRDGMTNADIRNYIHRIGWNFTSPDMQQHWLKRQSESNVHQIFNVTLAPGTTSSQAMQIVKLGMAGLNRGIRSRGNSSGDIVTTPNRPSVLHLAAPGLYP